MQILRTEIKYGFLEDAKETCRAWKNWVSRRGPDSNGDLCNVDDLWFLSYYAPFQIMIGTIDEGENAIKNSYRVLQEVRKRYPLMRFNFNYEIHDIMRSPIAQDFDTSTLQEDIRQLLSKHSIL